MLRKISAIFNNLKLAKKLTLLLLLIFLGGTAFSGIALANILNYKAQDEVTSRALLLIQSLSSVRAYVDNELSQELEARLGENEFSPHVIPSFPVLRVFEQLRTYDKSYSDFIYKEAMLNPTNIRDKANSFETEIVNRFRQNINLRELQGFRSFGGGQFFYVARPLAITKSTCLRCHSTPEVAPKNMIKLFGTKNGFGWKLNVINGAQIVFIPAYEVFQKARQSFVLVMGIVAMVFATTIFITNYWLNRGIVRPLKKLVKVAEAVSIGDLDAEFEKVSNDEIGSLVEAFTRMKLSLTMAIRRFEQYRMKTRIPDDL